MRRQLERKAFQRSLKPAFDISFLYGYEGFEVFVWATTHTIGRTLVYQASQRLHLINN